MSHLRAPAARADRREGGRHGRPVARPATSLPETHIRPQLLRLAVLPPIAVALSGCAAVLFTVRSTGAQPGLILWGVLAGAVSVALAGILIAAVAADRAAKMVSDRVGALRRSSARREVDLRALVEGLRRGEVPPGRSPRSGPPDDADDFDLLSADLARAHDGAVTAVVQAAQLSSQAGSEQKLEVFVNLARRLQSLVHREISILDELENEIEDPDLLKGLFHVDHLATRIRRHAENLAVLGGAVSRRQWSNPVSMTEVLRSAIAEVEQYSRVKLVPPIDGTLRGHAVADVIHLLAELVENATVFSAPHTQVLLRANLVTSGLAVEVEDRGLGMPVGEQHRMNALLTDPDQVNVASLLADGRIGLFVVSQLAKRHGIHVRLQTNIYGGVQAVLVVPQALLGTAPGAVGAQLPDAAGTHGVAGAAVPATRPVLPGPSGAGHAARHRGAPAEPRPGADLNRRESRGAGSTLNGSAAPTAKGAGALPQGARTPANGLGTVSNGTAPPRNGSGRAPVEGGRGPDGIGVSANGTGAQLDGGSAASHGGGREADGSDPLQSGSGPFMNGGSGAASGGGGAPNDSGARPGRPLPLPVRGARAERPNPAEAMPGIRPDDRQLVTEHGTTPPTPRTGTVRGTMGKPQLPRRRAQEHIAPQLRGGPAPRQETEYLADHDPGLMAAFQRGISLAETQQHLDPTSGEPAMPMVPPRRVPPLTDADHTGPSPMASGYMASDSPSLGSAHMASGHMDPIHTDPTRMDPTRPDSAHMGSTHPDPATPGPTHTDTAFMGSGTTGATAGTGSTHTGRGDVGHTDTGRTDTGSLSFGPLESRPAPAPKPSASFDFDLDAGHTESAPTTESGAIEATPMERSRISEAHGLDLDHTTPRHDGSAPAG
ncbi:ATP-binding protein [Streptomyces sp. NBC_00285]|uniref:ATP-binding protein n=1 Tax=Streptomyces sp. NBC_00285 TaxID=2975700 RepID=UPI002E281502|nr:ATP-binding protein [Streptomyces sp. NBC_00285]